MESYSFIDIFATKGLEYLFVIVFLVLLVLFLVYLEKPSRKEKRLAQKSPLTSSYWFRLFQGLSYFQGHTWAKQDAPEIARIGMDDFAQLLIGKPNAISLPEVGTSLEQGEVGWSLQVDSKTLDMLSPVTGKVIAVNEEVLKNPALVNQDPFQSGWLLKVQTPSKTSKKEFKNLLSGKLALSWLEQTVDVLQEKISGSLGPVLLDGGAPISGFAKNLSPERWEEIASEFFLTK